MFFLQIAIGITGWLLIGIAGRIAVGWEQLEEWGTVWAATQIKVRWVWG